MRGNLLSDNTATGVHQQSISRTFQSVDLSQLVYNRYAIWGKLHTA